MWLKGLKLQRVMSLMVGISKEEINNSIKTKGMKLVCLNKVSKANFIKKMTWGLLNVSKIWLVWGF